MKVQQTMNKKLKPKEVQNLFGSIAPTYDCVNHVITLGRISSWRQYMVQWSEAQEGQQVLDCATGTGDMAIEFKKVVGPQGYVVGSDFCPEMLQQAPKKAQNLGEKIHFEWGDVTCLKYEDNQFDISSMAYGIRNVEDSRKALSEMARVVKPHGHVMILETGKQRCAFLKIPIDLYFKYLVSPIGGWISGNRKAYSYLHQSSSEFPCREAFVEIMMSTGLFQQVEYKSLMGGASFIYKGKVIP